MNTIRLLERIFLILTVSLIAVGSIIAVTEASATSLLTLLLAYVGTFSVFGIFAIMLVSLVLHHHKNKTVRYVADVLFLACMIPFLATTVYGLAYVGDTLSIILLVSCITYIAASVTKLIGYVVLRAKPDMDSELDPDNDEKVIYILKWKRLLDKGVITPDEFQAKRQAILDFGEKEAE